ncbi:PIKK family atypical protein kinase [Tritrichomonas foetus]|uniref:Serine/threonine-protein kinase TOR n=1 Tax=Tritrichomonas foetus TaxID=1144522 RepID=A0A1J4K4V2_9EUKA|nr:PIKK family atypical protein kinase [Tritrichomonas foetus]|eukprot:OHT04748.1 PIKK family atypical protein kinase [Tritrichomonas foetus]
MKTRNVPITHLTYKELIENARKTREIEYSRLSTLSYEKLSNVTSQSINSISLPRPTSDPSQIFKISSLIYTLLKLRQDHYPKLISILNNLNTDRNEQVGIFVSYVYSKVLKHAQRGFLQQKLDVCLLKLQSTSNVLQTAYFLFFLAQHSPNSILLCITQFINATTKVIMHKREDVRLVGYETLKLYLQILERTGNSQYPTFPLYFFALKNLHNRQGAFLIFSSLLEYSPESINDQAVLMDFFIKLLPECSEDLRSLVLRNLVLLAPLQLDDFKRKYFKFVVDSLWRENNLENADSIVSSSLCDLIHLVPELFESTKMNFIIIIRNLLNLAFKAPLDGGFLILSAVVTYFPEVIQEHPIEIANILIQTTICKMFIEVVPKIFYDFNCVWDKFKFYLSNKIINDPHYIENEDILNFLATCPPLESQEVMKFLITTLSHKNPNIRCIAPRALLAHIPYDNKKFIQEIVFRLITISLSDPEPKVREMILRSFSSKCYPFLTTDPILTCMTSLVKDEKINVSNAAIEILGNLSKLNPFDSLPTLRSLILDALLMLDSPRPLRIKEEMTRTFMTIIEAAHEILPVYCPTLCLIALRQLSFTPLCELTYFDQSYLHKINLNITKAIGSIADRDVSLIQPHIPQFTNFFIWLLQQHGPKQLKIAVVTTLYKIMSGTNAINEIDVAPMFSALTMIASKWNSRKLNVAVLKLIGLIGAVDQSIFSSDSTTKKDNTIKSTNPAYPMACACRTLISVLSDDFLVIYHSEAIRSLVNIFCFDETATVSFFNEFMLLFLDQIRKQMTSEYIMLLTKLCSEAPRDWIMHYTNEILELIRELWKSPNSALTLDLIPTIAAVFADRFSSFLPECMTFVLDTLYANRTSQYEICHKVFATIVTIKNISKDYHFLLFPEIIEVATLPSTLFEVRIDALISLKVLVQQTYCIPFSAAILRCIISCIQIHDPKIQGPALMVLYSLMIKLGDLFSFYAEQIVLTLQEHNLLTAHFLELLQSKTHTYEESPFIDTEDPFTVVPGQDSMKSKTEHVIVNEDDIKSALLFQDEETPWNWKEWYRSIIKTLLENCPSRALNSCAFLSDVLFTTAENLFNTSFMSIWVNLSTDTQLYITGPLTRALLSEALPGAIRTSLVNLFDFMERNEHPIQISRQVLCQASEKCSQFAKAFYFVLRWYEEDPHNIEAIETLIRLSTSLGLKKTIIGISKQLSSSMDFVSNPQWSEQLGQWSNALEVYEKMPPTAASLEGILRCLKNLQRWDEIISKMDEFENLPTAAKHNMAAIVATALFHRQQWSKLPPVLEYCTHESVRVLIITALYQISQNKRDEALQTVAQGFQLLAQNARGVFKHDKAALYPLLVKAQQLQEITEIAYHKQNLEVWEKRLSLCRQSYDVYHQIMSVHLTVFPVQETMKDSLKMIKLAMRTKDFQLFDASLHFLFPDQQNWPIEVSFLYAKGTWERGLQREALTEAKEILRKYRTDDKNLKAKIFFCCGQWIISMTPPNKVSNVIQNAIKFLEQSIMQGTHYYHAWHRWAWASSVIYNVDKSNLKSAFNAINGFLECVRLKNENLLSELLQMISLFFSANLSDDMFNATAEHIAELSDPVLLKIIPQLFIQLSHDGTRSSAFASQITEKLLPDHFHVLLYPLILLSRNNNRAAISILETFQEENPSAVYQSKIVSDGLLLCSSSTFEIYNDAIVKAVRYLQKQKIDKAQKKLFDCLQNQLRPGDAQQANELKNELESIYNTMIYKLPQQNAFKFNYGIQPGIQNQTNYINQMNKLNMTHQHGKQNIRNNEKMVEMLVRQFIKALQSIYSKIHSHIVSNRTVSMHISAPSLAQLKNSILAVPGTYSIDEQVINIFQFDPTLDIFNSKMRPRLVAVYGSDGIAHRSLLKGREDLRMDQRVMQFFELINQHIFNDFTNEARSMKITTYSITPLSTNAGLIQFVDGTDTLYSLISEYRSSHSVPVFAEQDSMETFSIKNVDLLTPVQRLEALRFAANENKDTDLRELMWLNSPSSREWVTRSLQFTQSCALMSIIGYVIGLGDRHPSNLMIHRTSGNIVHIDFGDCFEVGKKRIKFPENVPFRLTRLMKRSFGPTGIDGEFRLTCEETCKLVRSHKESIMAVLDIFLQEPLDNEDSDDDEDEAEETETANENENHNQTQNNSENEENRENRESDIETQSIEMLEMEQFEEEEVHKKGSIEESLSRILQKIIGNDFDPKNELTIQEQVDSLIADATNMYNLAYLYHGWTPLW